MMDNVSKIQGSGAQAHNLKSVYRMQETAPATDGVEISGDVMKLRGIEGIRLDKVMEVKRAIAKGTYLTPDRLDKALDKALDEALG